MTKKPAKRTAKRSGQNKLKIRAYEDGDRDVHDYCQGLEHRSTGALVHQCQHQRPCQRHC